MDRANLHQAGNFFGGFLPKFESKTVDGSDEDDIYMSHETISIPPTVQSCSNAVSERRSSSSLSYLYQVSPTPTTKTCRPQFANVPPSSHSFHRQPGNKKFRGHTIFGIDSSSGSQDGAETSLRVPEPRGACAGAKGPTASRVGKGKPSRQLAVLMKSNLGAEKYAAFENSLTKGDTASQCTSKLLSQLISASDYAALFELYNCYLRVNINSLVYSSNGCRVLQDFVARCQELDAEAKETYSDPLPRFDLLNPAELLYRLLGGSFMPLALDSYGNYVIQRLLAYQSLYILITSATVILQNLHQLSLHPYGCRVIRILIERFVTESRSTDSGGECAEMSQLSSLIRKYFADLLHSLRIFYPVLMSHESGNYIIQAIISQDTLSEEHAIISDILQANVIHYGIQKFSSNIVERCLEHEQKSISHRLAAAICTRQPGPNTRPIHILSTDQYGNYIVQTLIKLRLISAEVTSEYETIIQELRASKPKFDQIKYLRKLKASVESL